MSTAAPRHHHRHRALAELDRLIARTETARARSIAGAPAAASVAAGKTEAGRAEIMLGLVDERLAVLRQSRAALLADEARQLG